MEIIVRKLRAKSQSGLERRRIQKAKRQQWIIALTGQGKSRFALAAARVTS